MASMAVAASQIAAANNAIYDHESNFVFGADEDEVFDSAIGPYKANQDKRHISLHDQGAKKAVESDSEDEAHRPKAGKRTVNLRFGKRIETNSDSEGDSDSERVEKKQNAVPAKSAKKESTLSERLQYEDAMSRTRLTSTGERITKRGEVIAPAAKKK